MSQQPSDDELSGMTINERLFACGLIDRWDAALRARRREELIEIFCAVALSREQAKWTVDKILRDSV
jgi:hypothetical protein